MNVDYWFVLDDMSKIQSQLNIEPRADELAFDMPKTGTAFIASVCYFYNL